MATYRVQGVEALRAAFAAFPKELATKALDQALLKAAAPIHDAAEELAPKATGHLAGEIRTTKDKRPQNEGMDARVVVYVNYKGKDAAKYWRYQEFGTSQMAPHPFMRPAFATQASNSLRIIFQSLSDAVPRIAATLSK